MPQPRRPSNSARSASRARAGSKPASGAAETARKQPSRQAQSSRPARKPGKARAKANARANAQAQPAPNALVALRELLTRGTSTSVELFLLAGGHVQEVMDEAVERGRVTRADAQRLVDEIVERGRRQTREILSETISGADQRIDAGRDRIEQAARRLPGGTSAQRGIGAAGDRARRRADKVRRAVGLPSSFPIEGYDDLTAAQINTRLADLTLAQLRRVREYETRNGNRKSVLGAIDKKLG